MRSQAIAQNPRRILCVFPRYTPSFGTFEHAYKLMGVRAFMPPQGILLIAAYLPEAWDVRFVDENIHATKEREFDWADAVFVSGMHIQRQAMLDIARRARARGKVCALGGPSVSASPELYGEFDYLHIGEVGDATDALIATLDRDVVRPAAQQRFETAERLPLPDFPIPAYHLIDGGKYMLGSVQFSSGCPYRCEFCDIPALYGRQPRLKEPKQILAELDAMLARGPIGAIYFVDDNFIANRKAARELLPHLIAWQKERGYPVRFACEATLNIAKRPEILALMREAAFHTIFCGIETPEPHALRSISKDQNLRMPVLDAVGRINSYGMEVVSGIILGLDTDTPETADHIVEFVRASRIPVLTINVLYALPKTPLWRRLETEGRIRSNGGGASNVIFKLPEETVLDMWRRCIRLAYEPEAVYERFAWNVANTFSRRKRYPRNAQRESWRNVVMGFAILGRIVWRIGTLASYRRTFWRMALPALKRGDIEPLIHVAVVSHHLIEFTRDCLRGAGESSFYSPRAEPRETAAAL